MITLPTYYREGPDLIIYSYYGKFMLDVVKKNRLNGMYGLTGDMLDEHLKEHGATLGNDELIFDSEGHKTMFMVRWS